MAALGITFCLAFLGLPSLSEAREFCQVGGYWCDTGHCCGNGECCTYYYELWWFWLVWFLIVFIIGFCVWQRKRFHPRRTNPNHRTCSIQDFLRGFNFDNITPVPTCKLPSYSEIGDTVGYDTPPPPYTYYYLQAATSGFGNNSSAACQTCGSSTGGLASLSPRLTEVAIETEGCDGSESLLETPDSSEAPPSYAQIVQTPREREMRAVADALAQTLTPSRTPATTPNTTPVVSEPATPMLTRARPTPSATPTTTPRQTPSATPMPTPTTTPRRTPCVTPSITPTVTPTVTPAVTPTVTPAVTPAITRSPRTFSPAGSPKRLSPSASPLRQCNEHSNESRGGASQASPTSSPLDNSGNSSSLDRGVTSTIVDLKISDKGSLNYVTRLT